MTSANPFKWKHYQPEIILLTVRWYLSYSLSLRNLSEMMEERGLFISHTTIMRWVHEYGPELDKRLRRCLRSTNGSWRVDETYLKVKGEWVYLYRAVDSQGNTVDFMLSKKRDQQAAKRFFRKALSSPHNPDPRVIVTDQNLAYPPAIQQLQRAQKLPDDVDVRRVKYLNNRIEQDHRFIKKKMRFMMGFQSFRTAHYLVRGLEAMNMIRKRQTQSEVTSVEQKVTFIHNLFNLAA